MIRCAVLAAGAALAAASSPRNDPTFFDGRWPHHIMGRPADAGAPPPPPPPCRAGLCAGAEDRYPARPGIVYYSEFNVPGLPTAFGPKTSLTDYLYFNIVFDSAEAQAKGGHFNQFVPQLMLGGCLTNSTGPPDYQAIFTRLDSWAIGAQYFFALVNHTSPSNWTGHAATGELIHVEPGDIVFTQFELSEDHVWTLSMGLCDGPHVPIDDPNGCHGSDKEAWSVVQATAPFMGLDPEMPTWDDPMFNTTRAGCCWEVYDVKERGDFPPDGMNITVAVTENDPEGQPVDWFPDWKIQEKPNCPFSPEYSIDGIKSTIEQQVHLDIFFPPAPR